MIVNFIKKLFTKSPVSDFKNMVEDGAVIVDIRPSIEFSAGHINGSHNIPLILMSESIDVLKKLHKPVILVDHTGKRSKWAKNLLSEAGIEAYDGGSWLSLDQARHIN